MRTRPSQHGIFKVETYLTRSEVEQINKNGKIVVSQINISALSAELKDYNPRTRKFVPTKDLMGLNGHVVTQFGIQELFKRFQSKTSLESYNNVGVKIQSIFKTIDERPSSENSKKLWQAVETHTLLLLESIFKQKPDRLTEQKIMSELDTIHRGLILSQNVFNKPTDDNIAELQTFVKKEAHGRTNDWKIWGGMLLAVAATGLFTTGMILAGSSLMGLPLIGAVGGLVATYAVSGAVAFFGKETGTAKVMRKVADGAHDMEADITKHQVKGQGNYYRDNQTSFDGNPDEGPNGGSDGGPDNGSNHGM